MKKNLAAFIDHTLLKADAKESDILRLCAEAREHAFYAVCVNTRWLPTVVQQLKGANALPIAVIGFPLGAMSTAAKVFETEWAVKAGAREIDMVLDVGGLKSGDWTQVEADIRAVAQACQGRPLKVILETVLLADDEIVRACQVSVKAGAQFVKTSSGFASAGANEKVVKLMRDTVGPQVGVKASGGIRDYATFKKMTAAGANRVGSSNSVQILAEAQNEL